MVKKRNYLTEISNIKDAVCGDILTELLRIGKNFNTSEEQQKGEIDFFNYPVINELGIEMIKSDGDIVFGTETISVQNAIDNDTISILDAIGLLEDLQNY